MKYLIALLLLPVFSFATESFHYPEDRTYTSRDKGYTQYGAPSLHKTGKYGLTFDDGPHPVRTPKILNILKKYNAKATFFVVTSQINESNFHIIKRMLTGKGSLASRMENLKELGAKTTKSLQITG